MTISHFLGGKAAGGLVLALAGAASLVAQVDGSILTNSLVQFGAVGVILAWLTLVDIPARNKAAAENAAAWKAAAAEQAAAWKDQLQLERAATQAREEMFRAALEKVAVSQGALAGALDQLVDELRQERDVRARASR
jgi:hypothetical protein